MNQPEISISNIAWEVSDDEQVSALLQEHAVHWIDLAPTKYFQQIHATSSQERHELRQWWHQRGVRFAGFQALLYGTNDLNLFGSTSQQKAMLDHLEAMCRLADELDARRLVFGSPRNRDRSGLTDQVAFDMACDFFLQLAPIAARHGVVVCLEPNPACYNCNFMTSTAEAAAVVTAVDHPAIRLQFDTGALTINQEDPESLCQQFANLFGHVHLSEPQLLPLGMGDCNHRACAVALAASRPDCLLTIEMITRMVPQPLKAIESAILLVQDRYLQPHAAGSDS